MKMGNRLLCLLVGGILAVLPACGQGVQQINRDVPMGRYLEERWELPENVEYIVGPVLLPSGEILMIPSIPEEDEANDEKIYHQEYYTTLDGMEWRTEEPVWFQQLLEEGRWIADIHFNRTGEGVIYHHGLNAGGEYTYEISMLSTDGNMTPTEIGKHPKPEQNIQIAIVKQFPEDGLDESEDVGAIIVEQQTAQAALAVEDPEETNAVEVEGPEEDAVYSVSEEGDSHFYVNGALLGDDGYVYINAFGAVDVYDPATGLCVWELKRSYNPVMAGGKLAIIYYAGSGDLDISTNSILFYDRDKLVNSVDAQMLSASNPWAGGESLGGDAEGAVYVASSSGIYHLSPGGELWERVVDGELTSLSLPSVEISKIIPYGDNQYLISAKQNNQSVVLLHYTYSPDTPSRPDKELIVYTLYENNTLQQAAGVFRQDNPDAVISIHTMLEVGTAATVDDAVRALNTELLAGKGPDLLLLDGLPLDSYLQKGVLADLTDVIQPMVDSGEILENLARAFHQDGKYYAAPTKIAIPTIWGDDEVLRSASSLSSLLEYAKKNPDKQLFDNLQATDLLGYYLPVTQQQWLAGEEIDTQGLAELLEVIQEITKRDSRNLSDNPSDEEVQVNIYSRGLGQVTFVDGMFPMAFGEISLLPYTVQGFYTLMYTNGVIFNREGGDWANSMDGRTVVDNIGNYYRLLQDKEEGYYYPRAIIGVNAAGDQQELAKEFVKTMLSTKTQREDLEDGFPVNTDAIDENVERFLDFFIAFGDSDSSGVYRDFGMGWPSRELLQQYAEILPQLDKPVTVNETLLEMVMDESASYFNGTVTAGQAAQAVSERAKLLLAE